MFISLWAFQTKADALLVKFASQIKKISLVRVIIILVLFSWQPLNKVCPLIGPSHIAHTTGQSAAIGHQILSDSFCTCLFQQCALHKPRLWQKSFLMPSVFLIGKLLHQSKQAKPLPALLTCSACSSVAVGLFSAGSKIKEVKVCEHCN